MSASRSRQLDLRVHPVDYEALSALIDGLDGVVLPVKSPKPYSDRLALDDWKPGAMVVAVPRSSLDTLQREDPYKRGTWILTPIVDPVVEVSLSPIRERLIHAGRLYFSPLVARDGEFFAKSDEIQDFATSLFDRVKKWASYRNGAYWGPATLQMLERGEIAVSA